MPTPFMCHGCDKPTMNKSGICDDCNRKTSLDDALYDTKYVNLLSEEEIMKIDKIHELSFDYTNKTKRSKR
tara:strand:+ start:1322 stop:1534 length:213 start_codon:yes stop_codon:yes gene_type:complete